MNQEIVYRIALIQLPGIGSVYAKLLTEYFKSARCLFEASRKELSEIPGIGNFLLSTLSSISLKNKALERAKYEIEFAEKHDISIYSYDDNNYPTKLKECNDGPFMLYYKGTSVLNTTKIISVVGTRKATAYGKDLTRKIVEELQNQNVLLVSGLAYGIDSFAHRFSLDYGISTVGVLAHGLDKIYPQKNRDLAKNMLHNGGLLSEFMSGTNPERENFPKRNRIVAGMSDATVIVEAASKGGALITANIANSYSRDVFAAPGRTIDNYSKGCNALIKSNQATLIESGQDILNAMNWIKAETIPQKKQEDLFSNFTDQEKRVVEIIEKRGVSSKEQIAYRLNLSIQEASYLLFNLELNGTIKAIPGNSYQIKG